MSNSASKPRILRITRPYESVEDYVESEGWTISSKRMILLDQPRLDRDTIVRFELSLQTGEKLIRAEARVVGYQAPTPDKPGGPKVRFKRFGGSTKSFIQQVVTEHGPGPGLETQRPSSPDARQSSEAPPISESPTSLRFSDSSSLAAPAAAGEVTTLKLNGLDFAGMPHTPVSVDLARVTGSMSDNARARLRQLLERAAARPVATPDNRDQLLAQLRERARKLAS